jgi:hypothetical protein
MSFARAALPALLLLAAGCGDLDEFDVTRSATITIDGIAGPASPPLAAPSLPVPLLIDRRALEQEGIDPDDVGSARLVSLRVEVTEGASFEDWLEGLAFHIEGAALSKQLLAQRTGIGALPDGTVAVDLETSGVDLKPYVLAESSAVTVDLSGHAPSVDTRVKVTATVRVDVNVSGLLG